MTCTAYVIFDGDNDKWAYAYMKGWKANKNIDFDFRDAHELDNMTSRAQDEEYVKSNLRKRMEKANAVIVLVGEKTKCLYKFVRWELELALELQLPIIVANLNGRNGQDNNLCPAIIRDKGCVVHVPYSLEAVKHALENFPSEFARMTSAQRSEGAWYYSCFDPKGETESR